MPLLRAPSFWWRRHSPAGYIFAPLGALYGRFAVRRMAEPGSSVAIPVICVGNLVLGGAGKTPTAIEVANVCRELRLSPGFLSRGYGGREKGPIAVSLDLHTARDVGDEPLLLAQHAPTVVSVDRLSGAKLLGSLGADVVVMDDGFQNPSLIKDLALIVVDAERGTGNGFVFPAGPLRAPLVGQIRRAHAVVVLGRGSGGQGLRVAARAGLPILRAHTEPDRRESLAGRSYLAFAGIADPQKFYAALREAGAEIGFSMDFPDHRLFSDVDCERILSEANRRNLTPITTEKDRVRLLGRGGAAERLAAASEIFAVRVRFEEPKRLSALIRDAVDNHANRHWRQPVSAVAAASAPA